MNEQIELEALDELLLKQIYDSHGEAWIQNLIKQIKNEIDEIQV
jgi:hypothetical protein